MKSMQSPEEILERGVVEIINKEHLLSRMKKGEKLRVKLGIDPTSPDLHLGRAVPLLKLKDFQDAGHTIIFIVGDFTGTIGDASDKDSERPMLTSVEVKKNLKSYFAQAGKILDMDNVEKHYNSKWLKKLNFSEIGELANQFSVSDFIARENVAKRLSSGSRVSLREVLYPLMQGYDSVEVKADLEIGGTDQKFNLLSGRTLQSYFGQKPQDILTLRIILGTDGRKMSSSWGNTINLSDSPEDVYGKLMRIPDTLMEEYFETVTRIPLSEIKENLRLCREGIMNPRDVKMKLAFNITERIHGKTKAEKAEKNFITAFQKHGVPEDVKEISLKKGETLPDALVREGILSSKGEFRRLREGGAIKNIETGEKEEGDNPSSGSILKIGKKIFVKIV